MAYYLSLNDGICVFYVSVVGLPYSVFFLNIFLPLIDRYVAITRPLWYRDNVTIRGVLIAGYSHGSFILGPKNCLYVPYSPNAM